MKEVREQQKAHITKEMFQRWLAGSMEEQEESEFLSHIGACTFCGEQFGTWMETECERMEPPKYLEEEILTRTRQLDIQTAVRVRETSKQIKLMLYSLKVGLAVAASIFLLTVTSGVQKLNVEIPKVHQSQQQEKENFLNKLSQGSSQIVDTLNSLSNGLFHIEFNVPKKGQNQEEKR